MTNTMQLPFKNRIEAAYFLAEKLKHYTGNPKVILLALPRGGVPVAFEVANALQVDLDLMVVRKLGLPGQEELAMGAIASGGAKILNPDIVIGMNVSAEVIDEVTEKEQQELYRREHAYRGNRPEPDVRGRWVILIDDGLATGATMRAAISALRQLEPERIVVAVPVAPPEVVIKLRKEVDEVACLATPEPFLSVGRWYDDFSQVSDEEVRKMLAQAWSRQSEEKFNILSSRHTEVTRDDWQKFCDEFSRQHHGWRVKIDIIDTMLLDKALSESDIHALRLANNMVFEGITDEQGVQGVEDELSIIVTEGKQHITHRIRHPIRMWTEQTQDGAHKGLRIDTTMGETTLIHFRVAALPEALDGVTEVEHFHRRHG